MPGRSSLFAVALIACVTGGARAQEGDASVGEERYAEHCASCHGERLRATGAAPDLKLLGADERGKFDTRVKEGKGQMPAWEGVLPDEDLAHIWAYIRSRAR